MPLDAVHKPSVHAASWCRLALFAWLAILLGLSVRILMRPGTHDVYGVFTTAARHWMAGAELYWPFQPDCGADHYRYSPVVAMALAAWTLLPDHVGAVLWRLLNAAVFLTGLWFWIRLLLPRTLTSTETAAVFLLTIPLSVGSLNNGQSNALMTGLLLLATTGVVSARWNVAAMCLAFATALKGYPLVLGLLLGLLYPTRLVPRLLAALALLVVLSFCVQPAAYAGQQYARWLEQFATDDRSACAVTCATCDWRLLVRGLGAPISPQLYLGVQVAVGAGIAALCARQHWAGADMRSLLTTAFGLATCWMTVFGPATESCTYILLAPILAWAVVQGWSVHCSPWRRWLPVGCLALFSLHQAALWFPRGGQVRALGLQPLAGLLLSGWLLVTVGKDSVLSR